MADLVPLAHSYGLSGYRSRRPVWLPALRLAIEKNADQASGVADYSAAAASANGITVLRKR